MLDNWYSDKKFKKCKFKIKDTILSNKRIVIYAGNIGAAQGINKIINLCKKFDPKDNIGFLFIGRGSNFKKLEQFIIKEKLKHILILPEIDPEEIPDLYKQCHIGLIILDERHTTHNIPGKFLSYLFAGMPVFAMVNKNNDLIDIVNRNSLGFASDCQEPDYLKKNLLKLFRDKESQGTKYSKNCIQFANSNFIPSICVNKILANFKKI